MRGRGKSCLLSDHGIENGELRPGLDPDVLACMSDLPSPPSCLSRGRPSDAYIEAVIDTVFAGVEQRTG